MTTTAALLLSAGESRRMGRLKALLPWQGSTLLAHQIAALTGAGVERVVVVVGHQSKQLAPIVEQSENADWVLNPDYLQGKITSIKAGLESLSLDKPATLLILNVDQPRSAETIRQILQHHLAGDSLITIPAYQGKGGHPIVLDIALWDELCNIDEETQGIRAVVLRHKDATTRLAVDTPEVLWDLNTPEQYEEALKS